MNRLGFIHSGLSVIIVIALVLTAQLTGCLEAGATDGSERPITAELSRAPLPSAQTSSEPLQSVAGWLDEMSDDGPHVTSRFTQIVSRAALSRTLLKVTPIRAISTIPYPVRGPPLR